MSTSLRRESQRQSIAVRQTDALEEFETLKKKYALSNKQIVKFNSQLAQQVEELKAEKTKLMLENLRLRASEISLSSQLTRQKDVNKRIKQDAERATSIAIEHLNTLRVSFETLSNAETVTSPTMAPLPLARQIIVIPPARMPLSKQPEMSFIEEGLEEDDSVVPELQRLPPQKFYTLSTLTAHESLIPRPMSPATELAQSSRKRPSRRHSGMQPTPETKLTSLTLRNPLTMTTSLLSVVNQASTAPIEDISRSGTPKGDAYRKVDAKPRRHKERRSSSLSDVTNSPTGQTDESRKRGILEALGEHRGNDVAPTPSRRRSKSASEAQSPSPGYNVLRDSDILRSYSPLPSGTSAPASSSEAVRERRVRKSVNYTEPKLNTKMRKPDPVEGLLQSSAPNSSSSASASRPVNISTTSSRAYTGGLSTSPPLPNDFITAASVVIRKSRAKTATPVPPPSEDEVDDREENFDPQGSWAYGQRSIPKLQSKSQRKSSESSSSESSSRKRKSEASSAAQSDSDGGDADEEYVPRGGSRRRSAAAASSLESVKLKMSRGDGDRRRSTAI